MRVVVVGAGLTGLATSALLVRQGKQVFLLEALDEPGGLARPISIRGHEFCPGPQYLWGFGADSPGAKICAALGLDVTMRAIRRDFARVAVGDGPLVDLVDGIPMNVSLSPSAQRFVTVLDRLGRASEPISVDARFCGSVRQMLQAIASDPGLTLHDKVDVYRYRDASVADVARRFGVPAHELRMLTSSQLIFAERLDELSVVVFAAARHLAKSVVVPRGGVAAFVRELTASALKAGVTLTTGASVLAARRVGGGFELDTPRGTFAADWVVWSCSPGVVGRFVPSVRPTFESGHSIGCVCLLAELSEEAREAMRDRSLTWFADDDDVSFSGASSSVRALYLMSPTLLAGAQGSLHVFCVYRPMSAAPDTDVVRLASALLERAGAIQVMQTLSLGADSWSTAFGAWSGAVYGRRLTASSLQTSVSARLPQGMSLAHSGAGIPGVLGCLQMAEAIARGL